MGTCRNCEYWNNGHCRWRGKVSDGSFFCVGGWRPRGPSGAVKITQLTSERDRAVAGRRKLAVWAKRELATTRTMLRNGFDQFNNLYHQNLATIVELADTKTECNKAVELNGKLARLLVWAIDTNADTDALREPVAPEIWELLRRTRSEAQK